MRYALHWSCYLWFLFLFIIALALFFPFRVRISFNNLRKNNSVSMKVEIFVPGSSRSVSFNKEISPYVNIAKVFFIKDSNMFFTKGSVTKIKAFLCRAFGRLKLVSLEIKAKVGTGDAAWTALLVTLLRQLAVIVFLPCFPRMQFSEKRPCILVYPSFGQREFIFFVAMKFYARGTDILFYTFWYFWETTFRTKIQYLGRMIGYDRTPHTGPDDHGHGEFKGNG